MRRETPVLSCIGCISKAQEDTWLVAIYQKTQAENISVIARKFYQTVLMEKWGQAMT